MTSIHTALFGTEISCYAGKAPSLGPGYHIACKRAHGYAEFYIKHALGDRRVSRTKQRIMICELAGMTDNIVDIRIKSYKA
jgi:hypothetical protein